MRLVVIERLVKRLAMDHQADWWDGKDHLLLVMSQESDSQLHFSVLRSRYLSLKSL